VPISTGQLRSTNLTVIVRCKTLHFGYNNVNSDYSLGDELIKVYIEERDLGVIVGRTLKSSSQCIAAAKSANKNFRYDQQDIR